MKRTKWALGALVIGLAAAPQAHAEGVDLTCSLPLTKTDPVTVNVAFPDEAAIYWTAPYHAVPGTRLRISGRYPHARYFSFNVYDPLLRPIDALADVEIAPDAGSSNPFAPRADRNATARDYTGFVEFGPRPADPAERQPNTLYTGTGQNGAPNLSGALILRVYTPDQGRDETGDVGLPTITWEPASSTERPAASPCAGAAKPAAPGINDQVAASDGVPALDPLMIWAQPRPAWRKFQNLAVSVASITNTPETQAVYERLPHDALAERGGQGGFLSNVHNSYLNSGVNRRYGRVLAVRMKAPTFPDTRPGPAEMPDGEQLRYFSMCQNEFATQRFIACRTDDQTALDDDGFATYVLSTPADRPQNARAACGATWIPWGPSPEGVLVYRHMLPATTFAESIQRATARREGETMGEYLPRSTYFTDRAAFERLGCHGLGGRLNRASR